MTGEETCDDRRAKERGGEEREKNKRTMLRAGLCCVPKINQLANYVANWLFHEMQVCTDNSSVVQGKELNKGMWMT